MNHFLEPAATATRTYDGEGPREETSLFGFVIVLLKYRGLIAVFMIAFSLAGLMKFLESKPQYTTRVGINVRMAGDRPPQSRTVSDGRDSWEEVAFFSELLRSPSLLRETARGPYTAVTENGTVTGPLGIFFGYEGRPEEHQVEMTKVLVDNVRISSSSQTGNIWIFVDMPYPELAAQIAANLVRQLEGFARKRRQAQVVSEREFVEDRLADTRAELRAAEAEVVRFRLMNRERSSPALTMAEGRLQRELSRKQQLYTALLQSFDRARIEEARSIPVITVLEAPERPLMPERSSSGALPILGAIAGLLIATVLAFIRERMRETAAAPTPAFEEFEALKRETLRDLKNPLRPLRRALKAGFDG